MRKTYLSEETYSQISDLRHPGESFDEILVRLVESVKKQWLMDDSEDVMTRNEFVELILEILRRINVHWIFEPFH